MAGREVRASAEEASHVDGLAKTPTTFDFIAEHTSDLIVRVNRDGQVVYISPSVRNYGYEPEEFLGDARIDLIHPDDRAKFLANSAAMLRGEVEDDADRQHRFLTADGQWVWLEGRPQVVRDETGSITAFVNIFRDVTARRLAEEKAREREELFETAFTRAGIGMALLHPDGAFHRVNPSFCRIVGYSEAELLAMRVQDVVHPEDAKVAHASGILTGEIEVYEADERCIRADGAVIWVRVTSSIVRWPNGRPQYVVGQIQDISNLRAAEEALKESEARYRLIAENTSDIILMSDLSGRRTYISPSVRQIGRRPEEMVGGSFGDQMHPDDRVIVGQAFQRLLGGAEGERVRWRGRGADGWIWMESSPNVLRDPASGEPVGFLDVIRDISLQVEQEQALAEARVKAEAAAAAKSQFLANMSHEIRTPLTAVLGFTSLLREDPTVKGAAAGYVERISGAGKGLLAIVNDVLDFSKLEAGKFAVRPSPTDVAELCEETMIMFASQAEEKGLTLSFAPAAGLPATAMIDADRLRQMLINLVGNAIKFTDQGSVTLTVAPSVGGEAVVIEVIDTGPGLDEAAQGALFQRFTQIDDSITRRHGGTGLGLAICRGLAEAMGGSISVSSAPGCGATFRLELPAPRVELPVAAGEEGPLVAIDGTRVFVVEDNRANRELIRKVLEAAGAEVTEAEDGAAALAGLARAPVDVVLMDLRMPGLDGRQTLAQLRATEGPNRDIPVLAFTADADVAEGGELSGFDGLVRKPIQPLDLYAAIASATQWAGGGEGETHATGF